MDAKMTGAEYASGKSSISSLEKEVSILKDTVWRLTGRIFVLETFLSEKFDELVVDFGLKLALNSGGNANFLAQAMQAEASVITSRDNQNNDDGLTIINESDATTGPSSGSGSSQAIPNKAPSTVIMHQGKIITRCNSNNAANESNARPVPKVGTRSSVSNKLVHYKREVVLDSPIQHPPESCTTSASISSSISEEHEEHDLEQYHDESHLEEEDYGVEEFVVFPHVPEFVLGQETNNNNNSSLSSGQQEDIIGIEEFEESESSQQQRHTQIQPPSSNFRRLPRFKCNICSKFFTSEWHLNAHRIKHNNPNNPALFQNHHTSSTLTKPFGCEFCGKRFKKRQELTVHVRIHTGEKPYSCPVCKRGFSQSSSMKTHLRIHTGERPFICRFCRKGFTVLHNYKKHLQTAHHVVE